MFCRIISVVIIAMLILLYAPLTLPEALGLHCSSVVSASMEPAIKSGGVVYYRECRPELLRPGDVIVFRTSYGTDVSDITHRVVANNIQAETITTKGDANNANDFTPVSYDLVKGKVVQVLPFGGNLALTLTSVAGKRAMAGFLIPAVLFHIAGRQNERYRRNRPLYYTR